MYICICNAVTEREIVQAIADGARTLEQLEQTLLVATCCGKCREAAAECLERHRPQRPTLVHTA